MARPVHLSEFPEDNTTILSTSYFPDNAKAQALRSRKEARLAELSRIEDSLACSSRNLAPRQSLWNSAIVADALLVPVRKLPAEILGDIFTLCIPQVSLEKMMQHPPSPLYEEGMYPSDVRHALREVCRQWNVIALATPRVWSFLTVDFSLDIDEVKFCIVHSKASPLCIYMEGDYQPYDKPRDPRIDLIVDLLRPEIHRMRRLIFTYPTDKYICSLFPRNQITNAPSLEMFAAISYDLHGDAESSLQQLGSIHTPKVHTILLDDNTNVLTSFSADSRKNLRQLVIDCPSCWAEPAFCYLTSIAPCIYLTELELWSISDVWADEEFPRMPYNGVKISLPYLRSLKIQESEDREIEEFLLHILVPSLELLLVNHSDFTQLEPRSRIPRLQSHFEQGLKVLHPHISNSLKDLTIKSINLVRNPGPIPLFTNLVSLHLNELFVGDPLLESLTPTPSSPSWPCPRLETLTFTGIIVSLPGDRLITLIRNRTCDDSEDDPPTHCTFITINECEIIEDVGFHSLELRSLADSRWNTFQINEYVYRPPVNDSDSDF